MERKKGNNCGRIAEKCAVLLIVILSTSFNAYQTLGASLTPAAPDPTSSAAPAVNPGRPSVTDIASLTAPGYLEAETGLNYAKGGAGLDYQYSQEFLLKLTDKPAENEYRVSTDGYLVQRTAPNDGPSSFSQGYGDTTFGIQHLFVAQSPHTYDIAGRLEYKWPTAGTDIGTGKSDYNVLLLASKDYTSRVHVDYNAADAFLGRIDRPGYVQQAFGAVAFSYAPATRITVQTELYGYSGNALNATNVANGYGITYSPHPDSEYDAYVNFGLTRGAPKFFATVGHTFFLGKLF